MPESKEIGLQNGLSKILVGDLREMQRKKSEVYVKDEDGRSRKGRIVAINVRDGKATVEYDVHGDLKNTEVNAEDLLERQEAEILENETIRNIEFIRDETTKRLETLPVFLEFKDGLPKVTYYDMEALLMPMGCEARVFSFEGFVGAYPNAEDDGFYYCDLEAVIGLKKTPKTSGITLIAAAGKNHQSMFEYTKTKEGVNAYELEIAIPKALMRKLKIYVSLVDGKFHSWSDLLKDKTEREAVEHYLQSDKVLEFYTKYRGFNSVDAFKKHLDQFKDERKLAEFVYILYGANIKGKYKLAIKNQDEDFTSLQKRAISSYKNVVDFIEKGGNPAKIKEIIAAKG